MTRSWLLVVPMRPTLTNAFHDIAALYPEVASMLRDGKG